MRILIRLAINAVALWATAQFLPGVTIEEGWGPLMLTAAVFGLVNMLIGPVLRLLTAGLRVMTLGLFTLVVNAVLLMITTWIVDVFSLEGGLLERTVTAVIAALIISVVSMILTWVLPDGKKED
jgi:putative membrane protein